MATTTDRSRGLNRKRLIATVTLVLAAIVGIRVFVVAGWLFPFRIASGSMGASWPGEHWQVECEDCGFPYLCDADDMPENGLTICPNCGWRDNSLTVAARKPGKRVLLDKWSYRSGNPRRWDMVVARGSPPSEHLIVKRVVALPGERMAIRGGDIYINEKIATKHPDQFLAVARTVHDERYRTQHSPARARWAPPNVTSCWQTIHQGFVWKSQDGGADRPTDWLVYTHFDPFLASIAAERPHIVMDSHAFNQATSRQLQSVSDLALAIQIIRRGNGTLRLSRRGPSSIDVKIEFTRFGAKISCGDATVADKVVGGRFRMPILFGNWDGSLFLVMDGETVLTKPFCADAGKDSVTPFAIAASGFETLEVTELVVLRDTYYFLKDGPKPAFPMIGTDEYVLLGDNQPRSLDARQEAAFAVPRQAILGRVLP